VDGDLGLKVGKREARRGFQSQMTRW